MNQGAPPGVLVDTDVLIAHLRGVPAARDWLTMTRRERGLLSISTVTVTEVRGGMRSPERDAVRALLERLVVHAVCEHVAEEAAVHMRRFRRSHSGIGLGDYLIAGTASAVGLELATLNVRHFPMFPDLRPAFRTA